MSFAINEYVCLNPTKTCTTNVLKIGPMSKPEKDPGGQLTGSTAVEPELDSDVIITSKYLKNIHEII